MAYPVMSTSVPWSLIKSGFKKTPRFNTVTQKTAAGRGRSSFALMPYSEWNFEVDLAFVTGGEAVANSVLQSFLGCYLACCAGGSFFLFIDPNDSAVALTQGVMLDVTPGAATPMGQVGDGSSTQFQLGRSIGQGVDVLQNVAVTSVQVNGVTKTLGTDYSVSSLGVVTFTVAPASNATLTWSGTFQYLCQFSEDTIQDLARVSKNAGGFLWSASSVKFESVTL